MKEMNGKGMEKYLTLFGDLPGITDEALQEKEAAIGEESHSWSVIHDLSGHLGFSDNQVLCA